MSLPSRAFIGIRSLRVEHLPPGSHLCVAEEHGAAFESIVSFYLVCSLIDGVDTEVPFLSFHNHHQHRNHRGGLFFPFFPSFRNQPLCGLVRLVSRIRTIPRALKKGCKCTMLNPSCCHSSRALTVVVASMVCESQWYHRLKYSVSHVGYLVLGISCWVSLLIDA